MNELDRTLAELARLRSHSEPIVSLYLDVRWRDEQQRERVRVFARERARKTLAHYLPGSPGRDGLARTLERVEAYVSGLAGQAYEVDKAGLALFACESLGLWRPLLYGHPFESALSTDAIPHLMPLVHLGNERTPAIVVVPGKEGAEIYLVQLGEVEDRAYLNRRAAAADLTALSDQRPGSRLVLVGAAEQVAAFERELPERVHARVTARAPRPREWDSGGGRKRDGVKALAGAALAHAAEDEKRMVDLVVGEALRGGLGVVGAGDVVFALNQGRVHTLVVEQDFQRSGWRCVNCGALGENAESAEACPFCHGDLQAVHDLCQAVVARTLADGGRVQVVRHTNKLHSYRGVAAFLRQIAPNGLRGASPPWPAAPGANQG